MQKRSLDVPVARPAKRAAIEPPTGDGGGGLYTRYKAQVDRAKAQYRTQLQRCTSSYHVCDAIHITE